MDLIDKLNELSSRLNRQRKQVTTEEASKTAFVLPFIQALGYDVFNPAEVIPEFTADHGVKKGEKVDYGIKLDNRVMIIVECKPLGADLLTKHAGQLYRYFGVTDAKFGLLTDGDRYLFFTDLDKENCMDKRPFFEFDLSDFRGSDVDELKKFSKSNFNLNEIINTANNLKYHKALMDEIESEFDEPSEELVKLLAGRVYEGRFTTQVKEQFAEITQLALSDYVRRKVDQRLKAALSSVGSSSSSIDEIEVETTVVSKEESKGSGGIETTAEEIEGHRILQAIGAEFVDPERIVMRDAKSYCAILLDDNNRRPICRLYFGKTKMSIGVFVPGEEVRLNISKLSEIYQHKSSVVRAIQQYLEEAAEPTSSSPVV